MLNISLYQKSFSPSSSPGQLLFILHISDQMPPTLRSLPEVLQLIPNTKVITLMAQMAMCSTNHISLSSWAHS